VRAPEPARDVRLIPHLEHTLQLHPRVRQRSLQCPGRRVVRPIIEKPRGCQRHTVRREQGQCPIEVTNTETLKELLRHYARTHPADQRAPPDKREVRLTREDSARPRSTP
jgi:hypothetical protein